MAGNKSGIYAVVEFLGEQSVEVVPTSWTETDENQFGQCYWPKFNVSAKVRRLELVDKDKWSLYKIRVFTYTDEYLKAKEFAEKAQFESNVEEVDEPLRRTRKVPRKFSSEAEDVTDDDAALDISEFGKKATHELENTPMLPNPPILGCSLPLGSTDNNLLPVVLHRKRKSHLHSGQVQSDSSMANERNFSSTPKKRYKPTGDAEFQQTILERLDIIVTQLSSQSRKLEMLDNVVKRQNQQLALLTRLQSGTVEIEDEDLFPSPLTTCEEIEELGKKLDESSQFRRKMASFFTCLGGKNVRDCVKLILQRVGTYPLWCLYSFKGKRKKKPFQTCSICKVITNACVKCFKDAKVSEVELAIADFLKYATKKVTTLSEGGAVKGNEADSVHLQEDD